MALTTLGLSRGPHITRYSMYRRLAEVGNTLPRQCGRVLSISHSERLIEVLGLEPIEIVAANYPDSSMLALPFEDDSLDLVVSDQVLEHIEGSPQKAIDECRRVLRRGGLAVHTTCFINPIHAAPDDFWRFTPQALALLHRGWSETIECSGWGNFAAWTVARNHLRYWGIPHATWHPLHRLATRNDPAWPIVTWIVARK